MSGPFEGEFPELSVLVVLLFLFSGFDFARTRSQSSILANRKAHGAIVIVKVMVECAVGATPPESRTLIRHVGVYKFMYTNLNGLISA